MSRPNHSLVLLLLTAACAPAANRAGEAPAPASASAVPGRGREDAGVLQARADSARLPWTEADARFMTMMIPHHAQAIEMARMAPTHGASPEIRTLAARIINAQFDEIATMQTWLRDRRQPVPEPDFDTVTRTSPAPAAGTAGGAHQHQHGATDGATAAPHHGMLTAEEMRRLDAARGEEFDLLFLRSMIRHHQGATEMVRQLFATPGAGQDEGVFRLATDVNVDQETEIARMQRMLAEKLFGRRER